MPNEKRYVAIAVILAQIKYSVTSLLWKGVASYTELLKPKCTSPHPVTTVLGQQNLQIITDMVPAQCNTSICGVVSVTEPRVPKHKQRATLGARVVSKLRLLSQFLIQYRFLKPKVFPKTRCVSQAVFMIWRDNDYEKRKTYEEMVSLNKNV